MTLTLLVRYWRETAILAFALTICGRSTNATKPISLAAMRKNGHASRTPRYGSWQSSARRLIRSGVTIR